uniref:Cytochrome c biogenesis FC n=3 Tax=Gnetum gnemon TaxID=3382 RepID=A0A0N7ASZ8_GNEGN|nr:cytochrome c biogenesis FC [Gnetum gnemon]
MVQPQNLFFFITSMVVPRGTAAPVLFQWFVGRDVSTGAPFFDGTIIPIPTSLLPSIVYLHSRGVIRSMDEAKSLVLVGASRPILLPNRIWRSSPETRAKDGRKVIAPLSKTRALPLYSVIVFNLIIIGFMRDFSYPESFRGVLCLLLLCTLILPYNHGRNRLANTLLRRKRQTLRPQRRNYKSSVCPFFPPHFEIGSVRPYPHRAQVSEFGPSPSPRSAQGMKLGPSGGGGVPDKIGLERCLALPTSRLLMAVGHGYYRKAPMMNMHLSHGGVCIFIMGVIWSRDPSTRKIQFTQRSPLGPELHMGKELFCFRGLDHSHGPTFHPICGNIYIYKPSLTKNPAAWFEHDESLRAILLAIHFSYENGKLDNLMHRERSWWIKNREHNRFWLTMFPEKRYFFSIQASTTKAAQHTNLFTDPYAPIGTGSLETGGWYTTMMKLPFIFRIRIGFLLAPPGGLCSLLRQLQKDKLHRNR